MRFVVRRPIFTRQEEVACYELSLEAIPTEGDPEAKIALLAEALDLLPANARVVVHCDLPMLASISLSQLPPARVSLAIEREGESAEEIFHEVAALTERGYTLALFDFEPEDAIEPWFSLIETVGMRPRGELPELRRQVLRIRGRALRLVAREVATRKQWAIAEAAGFRYFHGEYFLQSAQELKREIPASKLACVRLLQELRRPELDLRKLEVLIKCEPSFCYRLLRYLNSAAFFGLETVTSIRHAMTLLGDQELRRWLSMMAAVASSEGKPGETIAAAMLRARFCELLSPCSAEFGFMAGLFSLMPSIVGMKLGALLSVVTLPEPVDVALWGEPGLLRSLLDLAVAYERAEWTTVRRIAGDLQFSNEQVIATYRSAAHWANDVMAAQVTAGAPVQAMATVE
jgi:EAL and modified HD-GYP domain-containing signal transduction protein